jgi:hypothetical protein
MRADCLCSKAMTQVHCLPAVGKMVGMSGTAFPLQSWKGVTSEKGKKKEAKFPDVQVLLGSSSVGQE